MVHLPNLLILCTTVSMILRAGGEWVKCEEVFVGLKGARFYETRDFLLDGAVPTTYTMKLGIKIEGTYVCDETSKSNGGHTGV